MIFASPTTGGNGESYNITPSDSSKSITLKSAIAQNWHVTVLSGSHTVGADLKIANGAGQAVVKVPLYSHLTLSGAIANETNDPAGFTFQSDGTLSGNQYDTPMVITQGVLTLDGNNTFSGPLTMSGYGRLEIGNANALGAGTANFTLDGTLAYTGAPAVPTTVTLNRNVTFAGAGLLDIVEVQNANVNLTLAGQLGTVSQANAFRKTGAGTLTFANTGAANTLAPGDFQVEEGSVVFENGTFDKARVNIGFQEGSGDFYVGDTAGKSASLVLRNAATLTNQGVTVIGFGATAALNVDGASPTQFARLNTGSATLLAWTSASHADVNLTGYGEWHASTLAIAAGANTHIGAGVGCTVTFNLSGHSKFVYEGTNTWANDGLIDIGDYGATSDIVISNSASFLVPNGYITIGGNVENKSLGGKGTVTLNDSATLTAGRTVCVGDSATEGILNLNGGVCTVPSLAKGATSIASTINFNGGTLKAVTGVLGYYDAQTAKTAAGVADFIQGAGFTVNVKELGAKIDTNSLEVTITQELKHAGDLDKDGGLTKLGDGSLTLTVLPTYTGDTTVNQGGLNANVGINTPNATVYVATGATLNAPSIVADTLTIGGPQLGGAAAVPEPGTLALLALAGLCALAAVRRRM
jgi:autotransporter-associated beta strand protein